MYMYDNNNRPSSFFIEPNLSFLNLRIKPNRSVLKISNPNQTKNLPNPTQPNLAIWIGLFGFFELLIFFGHP